jgi:Tol biopolymer transport system component
MVVNARSYLLFLLLVVLLAACQPEESQATPTAAPESLPATEAPPTEPPATSPPTETAVPPTDTPPAPDPTPATPAPAVTIVTPADLLACQSEAPQMDPAGAGPLQIFYTSRRPGGLWQMALWDETSGTTVDLGTTAANPAQALSPNHAWLAFAQPNPAGDLDIGVRPVAGRGPERLLTTIPGWPVPSPEGTAGADLQLEWLPDSDFIAYYWRPIYTALGASFQPAVRIIDGNSGADRSVLPENTVNAFVYRPDGLQIAALTDGALWLVNAVNGQVTHQVALAVDGGNDQSLAYSPDGRFLAVFEAGGVAVVDSGSAQVQQVPLNYRPLGLGETRLMPSIHWPDSSGFFTMLAGPDYALLDEGSIFDVYWIDAQTAAARLAGHYQGYLPAAQIAEGGQHLAFWQQENGGNQRQFYLGETAGGVQALYDSGRLIEFLGWHPDRRHFTYWFFDDKEVFLGSLCEPPQSLGELGLSYMTQPVLWADGLRLLYVTGQSHSGQVGPDEADIWSIYLRTLDGPDTVIGTVDGTLPLLRVIPPAG